MEKNRKLTDLRAKAEVVCSQVCDPHSNLVWGEGNINAVLAIVGEAPGAEEDRAGRPYVGRAGRFLDEELKSVGLDRADIYITNSVKCRTIRLKNGSKVNRSPSRREIEAWRDILIRELGIVGPTHIMCLGSIAASVIVHSKFAINEEHGTWFKGPGGTLVMATFHPSYVLRSGYRKGLLVRRLFHEDFQAVADALAERLTC